HGCNSVVATKMAMSTNEYVVTEAGFGSDLGAEKFLDIKCRMTGLQPKATVIVVTTKALKLHGGVAEADIAKPDMNALVAGLPNLHRHIQNMKLFGQNVVVGLNQFHTDVQEELDYLAEWCEKEGVAFAINNGFVAGGAGAAALAQAVIDIAEKHPSLPINYVYDL